MLVCENGHVLTDRLERSANNTPHCSKCGAKTISQCPACGAKIRGDLRDSGVVVIGYTAPAPKYCPECGAPFPWTTASLDALRELAELDDDLDADDASSLVKSAETALTDGPRTKVAAMRVKKIFEHCAIELVVSRNRHASPLVFPLIILREWNEVSKVDLETCRRR